MYVYPYGDSQQLNLDWIINKLKELEASIGSGGADLEEVSNALIALKYDPDHPLYSKYDYAFHNGKLYRCISGTFGAFDPDAWQEALIGDDLAILTRWINALNAAAVVDVKFDTSGTNGKIQQKYNDTYHDVVEVDYTPVQNSKRPLSSNAGYDLNSAMNDISTTTNTLFTLDGLQIGKNGTGASVSTRAISADIYCPDGITVKAAYLPTNLKYCIEYYSADDLSTRIGEFPSDWITDNNTYTSIGVVTAQHFRIMFGSVDNNALTSADFDGLILQVNNGNTLDITAKDKDARRIASNAENLGESSFNALSNFGDAIVSFQYLYDSLSIPAGDTRSPTPNNLANKPSNYKLVGLLTIVTGNAKILIRGFNAYTGELNLVNIDSQAQTFAGSAWVYCIDTDILSSFFA